MVMIMKRWGWWWRCWVVSVVDSWCSLFLLSLFNGKNLFLILFNWDYAGMSNCGTHRCFLGRNFMVEVQMLCCVPGNEVIKFSEDFGIGIHSHILPSYYIKFCAWLLWLLWLLFYFRFIPSRQIYQFSVCFSRIKSFQSVDKHNLLKGKVESNCWCHFTAKVKLDTEIMYMHKNYV